MKIRSGFVSNSSSSSFIINKKYLSHAQVILIKDHVKYADGDDWHITEKNNCLIGQTTMDNFNMIEYMEKIGVDMLKVRWAEWLSDLDEEEYEEEAESVSSEGLSDHVIGIIDKLPEYEQDKIREYLNNKII